MLHNVERGMVRDDERLLCRQIVALLANPRIGPLSAATIAANLGVSLERMYGPLDTLIRAGRLIHATPNAYTAPPAVDGEPLCPRPYLAPAATPLYVPEALRGDWLLERDTEIAKAAKNREEREGERQRFITEETEGMEEPRAEREGGTAEGAESREAAEAADGRRA